MILVSVRTIFALTGLFMTLSIPVHEARANIHRPFENPQQMQERLERVVDQIDFTNNDDNSCLGHFRQMEIECCAIHLDPGVAQEQGQIFCQQGKRISAITQMALDECKNQYGTNCGPLGCQTI